MRLPARRGPGSLPLLLLLLCGPWRSPQACPRPCACYAPTEVHCTFRSLAAVPAGLPAHLERANLGFNSIHSLSGASLAGLTKLELLMLHGNEISSIPDGALQDLSSLQVLKFSYNKLRVLTRHSLQGLNSLVRLYLDHNRLEFIHPQAFGGLTALRLLHLEGNALQQLHAGTFATFSVLGHFRLSTLRHLYLGENRLSRLPQGMLGAMPLLENLYLHANPWTCDCQAGWYLSWPARSKGVLKCKKDKVYIEGQLCASCAEPRALRNRELHTLTPVTCHRPSLASPLRHNDTRAYAEVDPDGDDDSLPEEAGSGQLPRDLLPNPWNITLNMTDEHGNIIRLVCDVSKPDTLSDVQLNQTEALEIDIIATVGLDVTCPMTRESYEKLWKLIAYYSEVPVKLRRGAVIDSGPQLGYQYWQDADEETQYYTGVRAQVYTDPAWVMQPTIEIQLNRRLSSARTVLLSYRAQYSQTVSTEHSTQAGSRSWVMIKPGTEAQRNRVLLAGSPCELSCHVKGSESPSIFWLLPGGTVLPAPTYDHGGRFSVLSSGWLRIKAVNQADSGLYHCVAHVTDESDQMSYRVLVLPAVTSPWEDSAISLLHRNPGDAVTLPCTATAIPDAVTRWILPGGGVVGHDTNTSHAHMLADGSLHMPRVRAHDTGLYTCVALNRLGQDHFMVEIAVGNRVPKGGRRRHGPKGSPRIRGDVVDDEGGSGAEVTSRPSGKELLTTSTRDVVDVDQKTRKGRRKPKLWNNPEQAQQAHVAEGRIGFESRRRVYVGSKQIQPERWANILARVRGKTLPRPVGGPGSTQSSTLPAQTTLEVTYVAPAVSPPGIPEQVGNMAEETTEEATEVATEEAMGNTGEEASMDAALWEELVLSPSYSGLTTPVAPSAGLDRDRTFSEHPEQDSDQHSEQHPDQYSNQHPDSTYAGVPSGDPASTLTPQGMNTESTSTLTEITAGFTPDLEPSTGEQSTPPARTPRPLAAHTVPAASTFARVRAEKQPYYARPDRPGRKGQRRKGQRGLRPTRPPESKGRSDSGSDTTWAPTTPVVQRASLVTSPTPVHRRSGGSRKRRPSWKETPRTPPVLQTPFTPTPRPERPVAGTQNKFTPRTPRARPRPHTTPLSFLTGLQGGVPEESPAFTTHPSEVLSSVPDDVFPTVPGDALTTVSNDDVFTTHHSDVLPSVPSDIFPTVPSDVPGDVLTTVSNDDVITTISNDVFTTSPDDVLAAILDDDFTNDIFLAIPDDSITTMSNAMFTVEQDDVFTTVPNDVLTPVRVDDIFKTTRKDVTGLDSPAEAEGIDDVIGTKAITAPLKARMPHNGVQKAIPSTHPDKEAKGYDVTAGPDYATSAEDDISNGGLDSVQSPANARATSGALEFAQGPSQDCAAASQTSQRHTTERAPHTAVPTSGGTEQVPFPAPPGAASRENGDHVGGLETASSHWKWAAGQAPSTVPAARQAAWSRRPEENQEVLLTDTQSPQPRVPESRDVTPGRSGGSAPTLVTGPRTTHKAQGLAPTLYEPHFPNHPAASTSRPAVLRFPVPGRTESSTPAPWPPLLRDFPHSPLVPPEGVTLGPPSPPAPRPQRPWPGPSHVPWRQLAPARPAENAPQASQAPVTVTVPTEADAVLHCGVSREPWPLTTWRKVSTGTMMTPSTRTARFEVLRDGSLVIHRVQAQDAGQYECSAGRSLGLDVQRVLLVVLARPARDVTVSEGDSVSLECLARGSPVLAVGWVLPGGARLANRTLSIRGAEPAHGGLYLCLAGAERFALRLHVAPRTPRMHHVTQSPIVSRGAGPPAVNPGAGPLATQLRTQPPVVHRGTQPPLDHHSAWPPWRTHVTRPPMMHHSARHPIMKPEAKPPTMHQAEKPTPSPHVTGPPVRNPASGPLTMHPATGPPARHRLTRPAIVQHAAGPPAMPHAVRPPIMSHARRAENMTLRVGSSAQLPCSVHAVPPAALRWVLPGGIHIRPAQVLGRKYLVFPNGTLLIRDLEPRDAGRYDCEAANALGWALRTVHLGVPSTPASARITSATPRSTLVRYGAPLLLHCSARGEPAPRVLWRLPSRRLLDALFSFDSRVQAFSNGSLAIRAMTEQDAGEYLCLARNAVGDDSAVLQVGVLTEPARIAPQEGTERRVPHGGSLQLDCEATGWPDPEVSWGLPDGRVLHPGAYGDLGRRSQSHAVLHNGTLFLRAVGARDDGEYTCQAENPLGRDQVQVRVHVLAEPPGIQNAEVQAGPPVIQNTEAVAVFPVIQNMDDIAGAPAIQNPKVMAESPIIKNREVMARPRVIWNTGDKADAPVLQNAKILPEPTVIRKEEFMARPPVIRNSDVMAGTPVIWNTGVMPGPSAIRNTETVGKPPIIRSSQVLAESQVIGNSDVMVGPPVIRNADIISRAPVIGSSVVMARPHVVREPTYSVLQVHYGDEAALQCQPRGAAVPMVMWWSPAGRPITESSDKYRVDARGTLRILRTQRSDSGNYTCAAGAALKVVRVDVTVRAPRINGRRDVITHQAATAGSRKLIDCRADGIPTPSVLWAFPEGVVLPAPYAGQRVAIHRNGTLDFRQLRKSDARTLQCIARNEGGEARMTVHLRVLEAADAGARPEVQAAGAERITAWPGHTIRLLCAASGLLPPGTRWVLPDGTELYAGQHRPRFLHGGDGALHIRDLTAGDAGAYRCEVRTGRAEKLVLLQVALAPEPGGPEVKEPELARKEGRKHVGQPEVGKQEVGRLDVANPDYRKQEASIPEVTRPDYTQPEINPEVLRVSIRKPEGRKPNFSNPEAIKQEVNLPEVNKPKVSKPEANKNFPNVVSIINGETLHLPCAGFRGPHARFSWTLPNGMILEGSQSQGRTSVWENGTLTVRQVSVFDRGMYACRVSGRSDPVVTSVPVIVIAYPPRITSEARPVIYVQPGSSVMLECQAMGIPKPEIRWELPDRSWLTTGSQAYLHGHHHLHPQGSLSIQQASARDAGLYRCIARNILGADVRSTYIHVY